METDFKGKKCDICGRDATNRALGTPEPQWTHDAGRMADRFHVAGGKGQMVGQVGQTVKSWYHFQVRLSLQEVKMTSVRIAFKTRLGLPKHHIFVQKAV